MDKSLIEKYKAEMLDMYRKNQKTAVMTAAGVSPVPPETAPETEPVTDTTMPNDDLADSTGKLIVIVTTLRSLYPLENAEVTVFTGDSADRQVAAKGLTDQSGRTRAFVLKTPAKSLSMTSDSDGKPYASYNIEVKAEGYTDNLYLNVPVFSGVTSLQRANMVLLEASGNDKGPIISDESQQYNLT